jgi:hypothetical protein
VGARVQGDFILQHNLWDKSLQVKWNVLNVYGSAHEEHKEDFLGIWLHFVPRIKTIS